MTNELIVSIAVRMTFLALAGALVVWRQKVNASERHFLVVDRLMPDWPSLVFNEPSMGGIQLLKRAIDQVPETSPQPQSR